jgi:uncharacterized membrane protein YdcZ (DUF606 family)
MLFSWSIANFSLLSYNKSETLPPIFIAHPAVISFLQGTTLIFSVLLSWVLTQKIARQPWRSLIPQHLSVVILAIALWLVIVVPT